MRMQLDSYSYTYTYIHIGNEEEEEEEEEWRKSMFFSAAILLAISVKWFIFYILFSPSVKNQTKQTTEQTLENGNWWTKRNNNKNLIN